MKNLRARLDSMENNAAYVTLKTLQPNKPPPSSHQYEPALYSRLFSSANQLKERGSFSSGSGPAYSRIQLASRQAHYDEVSLPLSNSGSPECTTKITTSGFPGETNADQVYYSQPVNVAATNNTGVYCTISPRDDQLVDEDRAPVYYIETTSPGGDKPHIDKHSKTCSLPGSVKPMDEDDTPVYYNKKGGDQPVRDDTGTPLYYTKTSTL